MTDSVDATSVDTANVGSDQHATSAARGADSEAATNRGIATTAMSGDSAVLSATDAAVDGIFRYILQSDSQQLPSESELCDKLSMSRTTVRAALQTLQAKNVILKQPKKKTTILPKEYWDWFDPTVLSMLKFSLSEKEILRHVGSLRLSFEPNAAALCALNCSMRDLVELEKGCKLMQQSVEQDDAKLYEQGDIMFHSGIFLGTKNPFFVRLQSLLINTSILSITYTIDDGASHAQDSLQDHLNLFEAIRFKDAPQARTIMRKIVSDALVKIFADDPPQYLQVIV